MKKYQIIYAERRCRMALFIQQLMMRFLRRRGWVVFYLEEQLRVCNSGTCWLCLYRQQEKGK